MTRVFSQSFCVVGAIIEKDGKILLIREGGEDKGLRRFDLGKWSQPAGWVEVGESPVDAIKKEVREEAGYDFEPTALLAVNSLVRKDLSDKGEGTPHAIKLLFVGKISGEQKPLADDSSETRWFTPEEIYAMDKNILRDSDIKQAVKDYFLEKRYPLEMIHHIIQE